MLPNLAGLLLKLFYPFTAYERALNYRSVFKFLVNRVTITQVTMPAYKVGL
jgi:hypothetical protein